MDAQGDWLINHPEVVSVKIYGYADPRGDADYNQILSQNRADAITNYLKNYLTANHGDPTRLVTGQGMGEQDDLNIVGTQAQIWQVERHTEMRVKYARVVSTGGTGGTGSDEAISQLFILDKVRFKTTANGTPLEIDTTAQVTTPAPVITAADALPLLTAAKQEWISSSLFTGVAEALANVNHPSPAACRGRSRLVRQTAC